MLTMYVNVSEIDSPYGTSGVEWIEFDPGTDYFIFSRGSDLIADGQPIPSQNELISAGIVLTGVEQIVDKYFIADVSGNVIREIPLMGNQNTRYVIAFDFDAATASEPVFEVWDDDTLLTVEATILGSGTPSQSFIRAITTTAALPGTNWVGSRLAGSGSGNFLYLNNENGALLVATTLYANMKIIIPASQLTGFSVSPAFVCKYLDA